MVLARICAAAAAALAAATLAAPASAGSLPEGQPEGGAIVTPMDRSGRPVGASHLAQPSGAPASDIAARKAGLSGGKRKLQTYSGCLQLDAWRNSYSVFGALVYRWHQVKYWCWQGNRITTVNVTAYPTNVDPNWSYKGLASSAGWYYTWCCGSTTSGHYSLRQARFENCILKFGCIGTEYPWVKIWAHGDGSYAYAYGS